MSNVPSQFKGELNITFRDDQSGGNLTVDGELAADELTVGEVNFTDKADKAPPAAAGNFAALDADGNLIDSEVAPSDFATAEHVHAIADVSGAGSAAALDAGTGAGNVPVLDEGGKIASSFLPTAAASGLGAVKVGSGLYIDYAGTLNVDEDYLDGVYSIFAHGHDAGAITSGEMDTARLPSPLYQKRHSLGSGVGDVFITLYRDKTIYYHTPVSGGITYYRFPFVTLTETVATFELTIVMPAPLHTIVFPANVSWLNGEIPDMSASGKTYIFAFRAYDSGTLGTNWVGNLEGSF